MTLSISQLSELNNNSINKINNSGKFLKNNKNNLAKNNYNIKKNNSTLLTSQKKVQSNRESSSSNYSVSSNNKSKTLIKKEKDYELVDFPKQGQSFGTYKGKTPKQAAKKAFSKLARASNLNNSNQKFIVFVIRSKVPNKNGIKREFKYMGQRVKLERGIEIKRGNKTVTIKYKNIVNKYKDL